MSYITGKLKKDVIVDGVVYPAGSVAAFPVQLGLEDYFEKSSMTDKIENKEVK